MDAGAVVAAPDADVIGTLLLVDDEPNILRALHRLFRPCGYRVLAASGGEEALGLLATTHVDLVIADMRMPGMDGAQLLERVKAGWPDAVRILLTGHADVASTIAAINQGEIYRYVAKPWNDTDVLLLVRGALERRRLEQEKRRLERLTHEQNERLHALNTTLEERVRERTAALDEAVRGLEAGNAKLKSTFLQTVKVFSSLIEMRDRTLAGHSRRVADLALRIGRHMGLPPAQTQEILFAGLLHEIGTIGLPDRALHASPGQLAGTERALLLSHPVRAQGILMGIEDLRGAAALIRSLHERHDGSGYPDGLSGEEIPPGARVLAVANDYDVLQLPLGAQGGMTAEKAREAVLRGRGVRYDAQVVDAFVEVLRQSQAEAARAPRERVVPVERIEPGMVLSRDLHTRDGALLLAAGYVLDGRLVHSLRELARTEARGLTVSVRADE